MMLQYRPGGSVVATLTPLGLHAVGERFSQIHAFTPRPKLIVSGPGAVKFVTGASPAARRKATMFAIAPRRCSQTQFVPSLQLSVLPLPWTGTPGGPWS